MLTKLGKYEIRHEIGRGSMGVVYAAYDPDVQRAVAVKVASAEGLTGGDLNERFRKMFFNEAQAGGMLRHPAILDIFDAGVDDEKCYLVMELIPNGDTLRTFCRADNLLPMNQAVEIIFQCAKALDYAHRQGVIHRDIKPSNILLTPELAVKIADFSIAHINHVDLSQTLAMGFVGSPRYMSPEQLQEDPITHQTDLYALGVVFYELLTGRHPFGGESFSNLMYRVLNEPPTPLEYYRPDLPPMLVSIVSRCLEKLPARRYRMGIDLATDLSVAFTHLARPPEDIPMRDKFERIKDLAFFRGFPDVEIWELLRASLWRNAVAGATIIEEGQDDDTFFIIVSGTVTVTKRGHVLAQLAAGECFGEMSYFNKAKRIATVTADAAVILMRVDATRIEQVSLEGQLRFSRGFLRALSERLTKTIEMAVPLRSP